MLRHLFASAVIGLISLSALAACPTSHFEPSVELGSYFPGSEKILAEQLSASPDAELALVYVELSARDPELGPAYLLTVVRQGLHGDGMLFLNWLKNGKPVSRQVRMSADQVRTVIAEVTPILLGTRYSNKECTVRYTHGVYAQMAVENPERGLIGGQVFTPMEDSEAGRALAIGRMLKKRALLGEVD